LAATHHTDNCRSARRAAFRSGTLLTVHIDGPITTPAGLDELRPLWLALHGHHHAVAEYRPLVHDAQLSWERRRNWYRDLLADGGAYFVARDDEAPLGYAMTQTALGLDDTFEVRGGIVEIITLVVAESLRSRGIGSSLVGAVRDFALGRGIDTVKVAVMVGNSAARSFYKNSGFQPAEEVLYLTL
jgi:ribosomal protein S18 acetylase RimI-like enzyme